MKLWRVCGPVRRQALRGNARLHQRSSGFEAVEIGTGAYPGDAHCKPAELLKNDKKLKAFKGSDRPSAA